jgi:hypothetical protein
MEQEYSEENQREYEKLIRDQLEKQEALDEEESQPVEDTQETPTTNTTEGKEQPQQEEQSPQRAEKTAKETGWDTPGNYLKATAAATLDVPMDIVGKIPGLQKLDESWDEATRFENETTQGIRRAASVIIPNIIAAKYFGKTLNATQLVGVQKAIANIGGNALMSSAIMGVSDYGETEENSFRAIADALPDVFGPQGQYPIPDEWKTLDGDDVAVRRQKNMLDETVLSGFGDIIGYMLNAGKPALKWLKPLDSDASIFKAKEIAKNADVDTQRAIANLDQGIADPGIGPEDTKELERLKNNLIKQLEETGKTDATVNDFNSELLKAQKSRRMQIENDAISKLEAQQADLGKGLDNLESRVKAASEGFDPDITPNLADETLTAGRAAVPPANVLRNAGDHAYQLKTGIEGTPAPITDNMTTKGFGIVDEEGRELVSDLGRRAMQVGDLEIQIGKFRFTKRNMSEAAWRIYRDIMDPDKSVKEIEELFLNDREFKRVLVEEGSDATDKVYYIDEFKAEASAFALNDLVRLYLGREVNEQSARLMNTLGKEVSDKASAFNTYTGLTDPTRVMKDILDKQGLLMREYGLNKYISGWQLRNKEWWDRASKTGKFKEEFIGLTREQFKKASKMKTEKWIAFRDQILEFEKTNPEIIKPLMEAWTYADGNVDTLNKLYEFIDKEISWTGLFKSPDPRKMNLFAKGMWGVVYNNTLSGLSGLRALAGNTSMMILKPMSAIIGAGGESLLKGDMGHVKRALYLHGDIFNTANRAIKDGLTRMKRVHTDADFMATVLRKDYVVEEDKLWNILDEMVPRWEKEGNQGALFQYGWANWNRKISKMSFMRTGTTMMAGVDGMTDTFMATLHSRMKAYDEVFTKSGQTLDKKEFWKQVKNAEKQNYRTFFDHNGVLTDKAAKHASGEIALNLDTEVSDFVNTFTTKYPVLKNFFMFPRTGVNMFNLAVSYTPLAKIPGLTRQGRLLAAGTDQAKIIDALAEHGIKNIEDTPNAMAIYQNLRNEYHGRIMMASGTAILGYWYAMAGNIRGNGPINNSDRQKLRAKGWKNKTINIGGKWVSYEGIPMLDSVLTLIGDLAYYEKDLGSTLTASWIDKAAWTLSATYVNNTPLYGLEPLQAAMSGDESAWRRITANMVRSVTPLSGALGVASNAITQSQKDIYNDFQGYITNRLPIASSTLPEQIDFWTGKEVNEIDNPVLRILNAISPIKVSQGDEPWRKWLYETGFDGPGMIRKSYKGDYDYEPEEREEIGRIMGRMGLHKEVQRLMSYKSLKKELVELKRLRDMGVGYEDLKANLDKSQIHQELSRVVKQAQRLAEDELMNDPKYTHIGDIINSRQATRQLVKAGDYEGATVSSKNTKALQDLLKYTQQ